MVWSDWEDGCRLEVKVQPRSSRNQIVGFDNEVLKVKLTTPPVDGEANQALIAFMAEVLEVAKRDVVILKGESSRVKLIGIHGLSPAEARTRLNRSQK